MDTLQPKLGILTISQDPYLTKNSSINLLPTELRNIKFKHFAQQGLNRGLCGGR